MSLLSDNLEEREAAYASDGNTGEKDNPKNSIQKSAVEVQQTLLHILATKCLFNTALHNEFTAVCSDFTWFGPSLSHTSYQDFPSTPSSQIPSFCLEKS